MMSNKKLPNKLTVKIGQELIQLYKKFFSVFLSSGQLFIPSSCRFYPTCSAYAHDSLRKYGIFKGSWLSLKRILKCNPFYVSNF